MKKSLVYILVGLGVLIVAIVVILLNIFKGNGTSVSNTETAIPDLPQAEWPAVSLIPSSEKSVPNSLGHYLDFKVEKINVPGADTMDYELVYKTTTGGQQGIPGTVKVTGTSFERNLLLGSASSGHYRFDEGVNQGTMTIKFRDTNGKMIGRLSTEFSLQTGVTALSSADGKFGYQLEKMTKGVYFVTMKTFLEPNPSSYLVVAKDGYAIFSSDGKPHTGI